MYYLLKLLKFSVLIILVFNALSIMSVPMNFGMHEHLSEHSKVLYGTVKKIGSKLAEKYQMLPYGIGGGARKGDGIWLMDISFQRYGHPLNEEEARKLIINCVSDFLEAVNSDECLRPFLKDYPFTAKNLNLRIFNYGKDHVLYYFPYIAIVTNSQGKVGFLTEDPSVKCGYYTEKYEPYDEAVAILKKQNKIDHLNETTEGTTEKPPQDNKTTYDLIAKPYSLQFKLEKI